MSAIMAWIIGFIPTFIAIISEIAIVAKYIASLRQATKTNKIDEVLKVNQQLVTQLAEERANVRKLNEQVTALLDAYNRANIEQNAALVKEVKTLRAQAAVKPAKPVVVATATEA